MSYALKVQLWKIFGKTKQLSQARDTWKYFLNRIQSSRVFSGQWNCGKSQDEKGSRSMNELWYRVNKLNPIAYGVEMNVGNSKSSNMYLTQLRIKCNESINAKQHWVNDMNGNGLEFPPVLVASTCSPIILYSNQK